MTCSAAPSPFPFSITKRIATGQPSDWVPAVVLLVAFFVFQSAMVFSASYHDNTFFLAGVGKGLLEHKGLWVLLITDPILIIAIGLSQRKLLYMLHAIPISRRYKSNERYIRHCETKIKRCLYNFTKFHYLYMFFVVVGVLSTINNIHQTHHPVHYYGNDVFDSTTYTLGFLANKFNLFVSWAIVYPLVFFHSIIVCSSANKIFKTIIKKERLSPVVNHPDDCFGFSSVGDFNVFLVIPFFFIYQVMYFLHETHSANYSSLLVPLVAITAVFLWSSIVTVAPIVSFMKGCKFSLERNISMDIEEHESYAGFSITRHWIESFYVSRASSVPYTNVYRIAMQAQRSVPILMAVYSAAHNYMNFI